jgi:multidrug resistance efflux pump
MNEWDKIDLRSDEVQEILSRPPAAIIRYGSLIIGAIVLILITGSLVFRYPDIVSGKIVITGVQPPVWLVARVNGKIRELYCSDRQQVMPGQLLAVIENAAETKDVLLIEKWLNSFRSADSATSILRQMSASSLRLGAMQTEFTDFLSALTEYENFRTCNKYKLEKQIALVQLGNRKSYILQIKDQVAAKTAEMELSKNELDRDVKLFETNVISKNDLETTKKNYLRIKEELHQLKTTVSYQNIELADLNGTVSRSENDYSQQKNILSENVFSMKRELLSQIAEWYQNYVFRASTTGVVAFNTVWKVNQEVKSGDKVFSVIDSSTQKYIAKIQVNNYEYGKIKTRQSVNIKVEGYPFLQFGVVKGQVGAMPLISTEGYYLVDVTLLNGLTTTNGKQIPFNGEINGMADILTDNRSLFERIMSPVFYLMTK